MVGEALLRQRQVERGQQSGPDLRARGRCWTILRAILFSASSANKYLNKQIFGRFGRSSFLKEGKEKTDIKACHF
jgi:hypothetical protein